MTEKEIKTVSGKGKGKAKTGAKGPSTEEIIVAKNVTKIYDTGSFTVNALAGIDLVICKGEMVSIMGPSGCGKTTLLNCFSGIDDITAGEIYIEGMLLNTLNDNKKTEHRAKRMGFVFQFYNLLPVLTAAENVELPLLISGVKPKIAREKAMNALKLVNLAQRHMHVPSELSGGERQRVTIARALVNDPAIVWADEPTGNLDQKNSQEIMDLMCRLNKEHNQTFVIVTHDAAIGARAQRHIKMVDGRIIDDSKYPEKFKK